MGRIPIVDDVIRDYIWIINDWNRFLIGGCAMKIGFVVGEVEQHQMELSFDQQSGALLIMMDGCEVLQDSPLLTIKAARSYELSIGEEEKHRLALQLTYGGDQDDEIRDPAIPRLSLQVSPMVQ
jgi:hypothetical protein